jgi:Rrf2 family protein
MSSLLKISEAAVLALHTVILLSATSGKHLSVRDIAHTLHASEHHLAKVLQRLAKAGLVTSVRGPRGGFIIGKELQAISLLQVFEAIEGPIVNPSCLLGLDVCINGGCLLGDVLRQINVLLRERLETFSLDKFKNGFGKFDIAELALNT